MREKNRKPIASIKKLPQFTTMNVIDGQAGLISYFSLIFYSLTIDNILNIVILIILATITINMAFGDGGLIEKAQQSKNLAEGAIQKELDKQNSLMSEYANIMAEEAIPEEPNTNETTSPVTNVIEEPEPEPEKSEVEEAKENGNEFKEITKIEDEHGNKITIPKGFKVAEDSGDTVQEGIVIEDVSASGDANVKGSQFVWIPLGQFEKDDGTMSDEIILGRYTFDRRTGEPKLEQAAYTSSNPYNYRTSKIISGIYTELSTYREGEESSINVNQDSMPTVTIGGVNATSYNLEKWVSSAKRNGGYYIGRYEASFAGGDNYSIGRYGYKSASKVSSNYQYQNSPYSKGTLWNNISQVSASKVAINTYNSSNSVKSDLMNSYAWDTAIVYIQEAGNTNYANRTSINGDLSNTGKNGDEVCKIDDLASNLSEWTTEYSSYNEDTMDIVLLYYPCVVRGGEYGEDYTTAERFSDFSYMQDEINENYVTLYYTGFRITLYIV